MYHNVLAIDCQGLTCFTQEFPHFWLTMMNYTSLMVKYPGLYHLVNPGIDRNPPNEPRVRKPVELGINQITQQNTSEQQLIVSVGVSVGVSIGSV